MHQRPVGAARKACRSNHGQPLEVQAEVQLGDSDLGKGLGGFRFTVLVVPGADVPEQTYERPCFGSTATVTVSSLLCILTHIPPENACPALEPSGTSMQT